MGAIGTNTPAGWYVGTGTGAVSNTNVIVTAAPQRLVAITALVLLVVRIGRSAHWRKRSAA